MKRLLLTAIAAFALVPAFAQKGTWLWYGNLYGHNNGGSGQIANGDKWAINTTHGIGYQLADHWHLGLQGSYGYAKAEDHNTVTGITNDLKNSTWSAGVFARYTVGKRLYAFGQFDLGWAGSRQRVNDIEVGKSHGFGLGLTPTVGANIYRGWCLNLSFINISWNSTTPNVGTNNANTTAFVYNFFNTFNFGVSKIFGHGVHEGVCPSPAKAPAPAPAGK